MSDYSFFGVTLNPTNGKTYWQCGDFRSPSEVVIHVKAYTKTPKHLAIYRRKDGSDLEFVEHLNAGTY